MKLINLHASKLDNYIVLLVKFCKTICHCHSRIINSIFRCQPNYLSISVITERLGTIMKSDEN